MKKTLLFLIVLSISNYCLCQWQLTSGSTGLGNISGFAVKDNKILAGTSNGIKSSTDNGSSWQHLPGLTSSVTAIAANGIYLYIGIASSGFGLSTNNGSTWQHITNGFPDITINQIKIGNNMIFAGTVDGLYMSTDNGYSWNVNKFGITNGAYVDASTVSNNEVLVNCYGVRLSTDNGANWSLINNGFQTGDGVGTLAFMDDVFYAGGLNLYKSTNSGANWYKIGIPELGYGSLLCYGNNIFTCSNTKGVYLSTDSGDNWADVSVGLNNANICRLFINNGYIYAGTLYNGGIFRRPLAEMLAIKETDVAKFIKLYPNPASTQITITTSLPEKETLINIYNSQGQLLLSETLHNQNTATLDISQLPEGIYMAKIQTEQGVAEKKFVKI